MEHDHLRAVPVFETLLGAPVLEFGYGDVGQEIAVVRKSLEPWRGCGQAVLVGRVGKLVVQCGAAATESKRAVLVTGDHPRHQAAFSRPGRPAAIDSSTSPAMRRVS